MKKLTAPIASVVCALIGAGATAWAGHIGVGPCAQNQNDLAQYRQQADDYHTQVTRLQTKLADLELVIDDKSADVLSLKKLLDKTKDSQLSESQRARLKDIAKEWDRIQKDALTIINRQP